MIGVFDSGIGGLTVVNAIMQRSAGYDLVYLGDTARRPYGNKSAETVTRYCLENIEFLITQGAQIIVIACNTAASVAIEKIRQSFDLPIFEPITPAVKMSLESSRYSRIGIIGSRMTVRSRVYEKKIIALNASARVYSAACPLAASLVEEGWLRKPETAMIVKKYLHPLKVRQIDTLILGDTDLALIKPVIQRKAGKQIVIVDTSICLADGLKQFLEQHPDENRAVGKEQKLRLLVTDVTDQVTERARMILKKRVNLEIAQI